ncbi:Arm DNA-binding domain-containing protein [Flavobacterium sp. TSSA_36]|uniref:Arm DNA-binding domain-containing protein n=1 Tax=Flavobacterium sp. TSSA_36 TaxID=3447669 RepID=UPI003F2CA0A4
MKRLPTRNTTVSVLFYSKRSKVNSNGICPIYARVTVLTKRFEFSSNKFIDPERWPSEGTKVKGTNEETRLINNYLENIKARFLA